VPEKPKKKSASQKKRGTKRRGKRASGFAAALRDELLRIEPAGDGGFEGLLAEALAAFSGLTFRLAKSGSQFGRDGSSTLAPFAVALEAKRYDSDLRLEDLAGKVVVAGSELEGQIDLWALGATSNVGDVTLAKLTDILEQHGIALLPLDWGARPLPPTAVLLSEMKNSTLSWFLHHHPKVDSGKLANQLDAVAAHPLFSTQVAQLREAVSRTSVGLDALRTSGALWLRQHFKDRRMSQSVFGQYITIADDASPPQARLTEAKLLAALASPDPNDVPVVAVLGGEGVGKTWLVAQWWLSLPISPIMLLVTGRRAECLIPGRPVESLAWLIAAQTGDSATASIHGWCRRLERWRGQKSESHLRFIVVLDGINEHAGRPWADLTKELAREAQALGGLLIVTCREGFWRRDVQPRLGDCVLVRELLVDGYSDGDLAAIFARHNIDPGSLSVSVREFLRNPRVCSVALSLLDRLSLQPSELTIERLLMEYWQSRLSERGNLVAHNARDFEKLLRSHAKAWREQPKRRFDRDDWADHSGAVHRFSLEQVQNDLTEIEEGRFLQIAPDDSGSYEFRTEVLPYALGLLINAELSDELRKGGDPGEHLGKIIDTIRGFDLVADVVGAAVGLACLDDAFPPRGRAALVGAWLGLQNIDEPADAMSSYVPVRPDAFLDAAEAPVDALGASPRYDLLSALLVNKRTHAAVRAALEIRLPHWLGRWSRLATGQFRPGETPDREATRKARIEANLASLSEPERARFRELTTEVSDYGALRLDWLAASLLAGGELKSFAAGLLGWALVQTVTGDTDSAYESLEWVVRLNPVDWPETREAIWRLTEAVDEKSAGTMGTAAAIALALLGDKDASDKSSHLLPRSAGFKRRLVENYCNTNPHDPKAPRAAISIMPARLRPPCSRPPFGSACTGLRKRIS
jgi:hypothetical protein